MKKNNKEVGITLITLVITIAVLVILLSVATYSGLNVIKSAKLTAFTTEMKIMQTQVNAIYENYDGKTEYGEAIEGNYKKQADKVFEELAKDTNIKDYIGYTYWSKDYIKNELKIEGIEQAFFVNISKRKIVSYEGLEYEGKMYYALEQLPNSLYNVEYQGESSKVPTFDVSVEEIGNGKWRISISNIQYEGYIDKWQVSYKAEGKDYWNSTEDLSFVVTTLGNYEIQIKNEAVVSDVQQVEIKEKIITVAEAIMLGTVLDETNPTTIRDSYGNSVKVPEGFKIASDSATDVTGGVVIEDVSHGATEGSQFVWIPVGTVYTNTDKTESQTITLGRYIFNEDGSINEELSKTGPTEQVKTSLTSSYYFTEELKDSITNNTHAKDIEVFRISAITNGGYYIGRYEARSVMARNEASNELGQLTVKPNDYVYNYVTQPQAATLAQEMYGEDKKFTSDLVNSYAWDTAILFLQTFDNRGDKIESYSGQTSLNTSLATQGTNNLTDVTKQDIICNVWDIASNTWEWTTETANDPLAPCTTRGGVCNNSSGYPSRRDGAKTSASTYGTFRNILYLYN